MAAKKKKANADLKAQVMSKLTANHIAVSFDTTGSMASCIQSVRDNLKDWVSGLFDTIPNLKVAIVAHGDYCDGQRCISTLDFTDDQDEIASFISDTPNTSGGDEDECYELVLNRVAQLSWPKTGGSFVMIGDASPHGPEYKQNKDKLEWKKEAKALSAKEIKVFALQCLRRQGSHNNDFWEGLAEIGGSELLQLENWKEAGDTIGICAAATAGSEALKSYEARAVAKGTMTARVAKTTRSVASYALHRDEVAEREMMEASEAEEAAEKAKKKS